MTDPTARDLIQRLLDTVKPKYTDPDEIVAVCQALNEARAYLAAPDEPAVPSDAELLELMPEAMRDEFSYAATVCSDATGGQVKPGIFRVCLNHSALEYARAVLARWGSHTPTPIPLSERLPTEADCNVEGKCLLFGRYLLSGEAAWIYGRPAWAHRFADSYSHWLPYWALSVPKTGKNND